MINETNSIGHKTYECLVIMMYKTQVQKWKMHIINRTMHEDSSKVSCRAL